MYEYVIWFTGTDQDKNKGDKIGKYITFKKAPPGGGISVSSVPKTNERNPVSVHLRI